MRHLIFAVAIAVVVAAPVAAADLAWDMVDTTSQNLTDYTNFAPPFASPGDGFAKYQVGVSASIPFALVDDSALVFPADVLGVIDSNSDFHEFFGAVDTNNTDTNGADVSAAWTFDISGGVAAQLCVDMGAMGDFEEVGHPTSPPDIFRFEYQIDGGAAVTDTFAFSVGVGTTVTYTLASGTLVDYGDPMQVDGVDLTNNLQTFCANIPDGDSIIVTFVANADGGTEGFVFRNLVIKGEEAVIFVDTFDDGTLGAWSDYVP